MWEFSLALGYENTPVQAAAVRCCMGLKEISCRKYSTLNWQVTKGLRFGADSFKTIPCLTRPKPQIQPNYCLAGFYRVRPFTQSSLRGLSDICTDSRPPLHPTQEKHSRAQQIAIHSCHKTFSQCSSELGGIIWTESSVAHDTQSSGIQMSQ